MIVDDFSSCLSSGQVGHCLKLIEVKQVEIVDLRGKNLSGELPQSCWQISLLYTKSCLVAGFKISCKEAVGLYDIFLLDVIIFP